MGWFTVSSGPSVGSSLGRWACPAEVWAGLGIVLLLLRPPPRAAPQSLSSTARGLLPPWSRTTGLGRAEHRRHAGQGSPAASPPARLGPGEWRASG